MRVTLRIKRFNPEKDQNPWWGEYVAEAEPDERLLDALYYVKSYVDGTLTFRHSCVHGVCGSDAMRINGSNTLACQVLVKNLGSTITIEPLPGLRVIKDLLVDMDRFFELYQSVHPYFICYSPPPEKERLQSPADRRESTIRPSASSAPAARVPARPIGPTRISSVRRRSSTRHRFVFDSRDEGSYERLEILGSRDGVWRCRTIFNCVEACPRKIRITRAITEVKNALMARRV